MPSILILSVLENQKILISSNLDFFRPLARSTSKHVSQVEQTVTNEVKMCIILRKNQSCKSQFNNKVFNIFFNSDRRSTPSVNAITIIMRSFVTVGFASEEVSK